MHNPLSTISQLLLVVVAGTAWSAPKALPRLHSAAKRGSGRGSPSNGSALDSKATAGRRFLMLCILRMDIQRCPEPVLVKSVVSTRNCVRFSFLRCHSHQSRPRSPAGCPQGPQNTPSGAHAAGLHNISRNATQEKCASFSPDCPELVLAKLGSSVVAAWKDEVRAC